MKKAELVKLTTLVKSSTYRGHDGDGYLRCDIKYKGKVIAEMHEDAWGGGYQYKEIDKKAFKEIEDAFKTFPKLPQYGLDDSLDYLVEDLFYKWQLNKMLKKDEKKGVLIGDENGYRIEGYKTTIPKIFENCPNSHSKIKKYLQDIIDKATKKGESILNLEYLKTYDLKA